MSNPERVQNLLTGAAELAPDQRAAYLDAACRGDKALRAEVESLLSSLDDAGRFMAEPTRESSDPLLTADSASASSPTLAASLREGPGTRIGPYKLLQAIGEGGFGTVFMAEQERPVQRKVALKIIKLGMDTRQVVARFEQERQALAMMDHPNIARVLDAGATDTGRLFFVMELVKGDAIVEYCDKNNLSIENRLELFAQVCNAVQHAHTKGIIHRDIKPSNILVSTQDGRPNAKVIDFGIAKATASKLTEKTLFTEHRQLIGTPEYMSPEQAEGNLDIDTRTDVYSLGVLLYELLTGTTPFIGKELRSAAYAEIQRIIREVEPPKPSTRISQNTETIASVAAKRHTEPNRLGTIVRGELDWIVMKALEKDRQRRYETASGLAMDVRRYLSGEAVVAAPPSKAYRFKKFVRRNRGPVVAAGLIAAALVLGVIGTGFGLFKAERARAAEAEQRREADRQAEIARTNEKQASEREAESAAVLKFVQEKVLAAARPKGQEGGQGYEVKLADAIATALPYLEKSFTDQPLIEARLRMTLGQSYFYLGKTDTAEQQFSRARDLYTAKLGRNHPNLATSLNSLALILEARGKYTQAEPLYREALAIFRATLPAGDTEIAAILNNLAQLLNRQSRFAEAEPLYREALAIFRAALPAGHPSIARSVNNLASFLWSQGKPAEAEPLFREALEIHRASLPPGHPDIATSVNNLATFLQDQNRLVEAEPLLRDALATRRAALPAGHPSIAMSLDNLAKLLQAKGQPAEAEQLQREALAIRREAFPAGHTEIALGLQNLASALQAQNKFAEAEPLFRESLEIDRAALPATHPLIAVTLHELALALRAQNRLAESEPLVREALQINRAAFPAGHPTIATGINGLAVVLQAQGKLAEAEPLFREAIEINRATLPAGHPSITRSMNNLAGLYWRQGKLDQSIPLFEEALKASEASSGRRNLETLGTMANLGVNYMDAGRLAEAIPLLEEAYRASKREPALAWVGSSLLEACLKTADPDKPQTIARVTALMPELLADARDELPKESPELAGRLAAAGLTLLALKAWDEAEPLIRECLAIREKSQPDAWTTFNTKSMLGGVFLSQKKLAEAEPLLRDGYSGLMERQVAIPPQGRVRIAEAIDRLIAFSEAKGDDAQAAQWRTEREKYAASAPAPGKK